MADFKTVQPNDPPWLVEAFKLRGLTEGSNYPPPCQRGKSLNLWVYGQR